MNETRRGTPALAEGERPAAARHGWLMVAGAFAAFALAAGLMQSYSVFLLAFLSAFGWNRADASIAFSVSQLVSGTSAPLVGALVDRVGTRRLMLLGGGLLIAGALGAAHAAALWHIVLLYGVVMTLGANFLGLVVFVPLLSRHFVRRRGMAISIVQSANGFGRASSTPLAQLSITAIGWRATYLAQAGLVAALILPLAALFRPSDRPPAVAAGSIAAAGSDRGWTLGEAVKTPHFWLLFAVYLFTGLGSFLVSLHQFAFAVEIGFGKLYAAEVLGTGAFLSFFGTIFTGTVSDYIGREWAAILAYGVSILGVVFALLITGPNQSWLLWLHACFFGLTWGARGPTITAKTADLFSGRQLGTILGVITMGSGLGAAIGSWGAGFIFDLFHSYKLAFILSIAFYLCGAASFWALRRPPVRHA